MLLNVFQRTRPVFHFKDELALTRLGDVIKGNHGNGTDLNLGSRGERSPRASAVDKERGSVGGGGARQSQHARLQAPGSVCSPQTCREPRRMRQRQRRAPVSGPCGSSASQLCSSSSAPQVTGARARTPDSHFIATLFFPTVCFCRRGADASLRGAGASARR